MSKNKRLKPCPFCGGVEVYWTHCEECAHVYCDNEKCQAQGPEFISTGGFGHAAEDLWDKRPIEDALRKEITHLKLELLKYERD